MDQFAVKQEKIGENEEFEGTSFIRKETDTDAAVVNGVVSTLICKQDDEEGIPLYAIYRENHTHESVCRESNQYAIYRENHMDESVCRESNLSSKNVNPRESQSVHHQTVVKEEPPNESDLNLLKEEYQNEKSQRISHQYTTSGIINNNDRNVTGQTFNQPAGTMNMTSAPIFPVSLHTAGNNNSFPVFSSQKETLILNGLNTDSREQPLYEAYKPEDPSETQKQRFMIQNEQSSVVHSNQNDEDQSQLQTGLLTDSSKRYECNLCGRVFSEEISLQTHLLLHNGAQIPSKKVGEISKKNLNLYCDVCNKGFPYKSDLERHRISHDDSRPFICEFCGATYKQQKNLREHMVNKHKDRLPAETVNKKFKCSQCPMSFSIESKFRTHLIRAHTSDKPFICQQCGNRYKYIHTLTKHLQKHGTDLKVFVKRCQYCGETFPTTGQLRKHFESNASDGKHVHKIQITSHACEICDKRFDTNYKLKRHLLSHTDQRDFGCHICGSRFKQLAHLNGHLSSHERESTMNKYKKLNINQQHIMKPKNNADIQGTVCGQEFEQPALLEEHSKIHENLQSNNQSKFEPLQHHGEKQVIDKPFKCTICNLGFKMTSHRKAHMCTHLSVNIPERSCIIDGRKEKIYKCEECHLEFRTKQAVKLHILESGGDGIHQLRELSRSVEFNVKDNTYECDICHQTFLYLSILANHKATHHKEDRVKAIKCGVCHLEFKTKSELKVHFIESEGDGIHEKSNMLATSETFDCTVCDRKFSTENGMKHHFTSMHRNKKKNIQPDSQESNSNSGDSLFQTDSYSRAFLIESNSNSRDSLTQSESNSRDSLIQSKSNSTNSLIQSESNSRDSVIQLSSNSGDSLIQSESSAELQILSEVNSSASNESFSFQEKGNLKSQLEILGKLDELELVYSPKGPRYKCPVCSKLFTKPRNVKVHMSTHNKQFKCDKCNKEFYVTSEFEHHKENQYQCSFCQKRFCKSAEFKMHYNQQHRKKLNCQHCSKTFVSQAMLDIHVKTHLKEMEGSFKCKTCRKRFKIKEEYLKHLGHHNENGKHLCDICGKRFYIASRLRHHSKVHNVHKEIYKCDMCDKKYLQKGALSYHIKCHHSNRKRLACRYCDNTFLHLPSLKLHEMKHTGNKPFECTVCSKRFYTSSCLKCHTVVHTKEKLHECNICHKKFSQFCTLYRHKKTMH